MGEQRGKEIVEVGTEIGEEVGTFALVGEGSCRGCGIRPVGWCGSEGRDHDQLYYQTVRKIRSM